MTRWEQIPLGQKVIVSIMGTTTIALILMFLLNIVPAIYMYRLSAIDRAGAQGELLSASLAAAVDFSDPEAATESLATLSLVPSVKGAAVYAAGDTPFATYGVAPARIQASQLTTYAGLSTVTVASPIASDLSDSILIMDVSFDQQWRLLKSNILVGLAILLLVFAASYKMASLFRRKLINPLSQLTEAVRGISKNETYSHRVDYDSDDEIGVLVAEFNFMLGQVEKRDERLNSHRAVLEAEVKERTLELKRNQLELLRNNGLLLSEIKKRAKAEMIREEVERINRHDLKSGLSLVIGYPELLLNEGSLNPRQEKHVKRIRAAGYRMLDMIRNQLDIFKMEKGIYSLSKASVDVVEVVCSLEDEFRPLLDNTGVNFDFRLNDQEVVGNEIFNVTGEIALMRTMLRNLIQNAIEISSSKDTVAIALHEGQRKSISITNPKSVPETIRSRFFDKYVTHGKENGTGLGTYFAALIAKTHGANISMKTDELSGTTISIYFRDKDKSPQISEETSSDDKADNATLHFP